MNTLTKALIVTTTLTVSMGASANSLTDDIERAVKEAANEALATLVNTQKASLEKATKELFERSADQQRQANSSQMNAPQNNNKATKGDNDAA
ncbi:hypothetical protein [Pseudoalteromonas pernae]|uniref:hypothetical protein n=1 Tax=Pseudoalteromonas pernae TaxID=3118054 RepID=UPI003242769D